MVTPQRKQKSRAAWGDGPGRLLISEKIPRISVANRLPSSERGPGGWPEVFDPNCAEAKDFDFRDCELRAVADTLELD
jgi:hypothetical protein